MQLCSGRCRGRAPGATYGGAVGRNGWVLIVAAVILLLAWWGLQVLRWRMHYLVPAFGLGLVTGVALTLWLVRPRR